MSTALHLAKSQDQDRLLAMVNAFHAEQGIEMGDEARLAGIEPLLNGSPLGVAYLMGPVRAPVGYVIVCFGWSVEFGGMDGFIDELYVRSAVRGRGIATEVLTTLPQALADAGIRALHLEVDRDNAAAQRLYARAGFVARPQNLLMSKRM